jgi:type IV secretion system protein VirB11
MVNRAGEIWVETASGAITREAAPQITELALGRLARQIAASSHQGVNREQPLLSAALPDGGRVQVVAPPATRDGLILAVRKHVISDLSLDELDRGGLFAPRAAAANAAAADAELEALLDRGETAAFLKLAVRRRKTIVISGGAGAGKTTLLNALVKEIDPAERLVAIEDAPEIRLDRPNAVGLIAVRGDQGEARVDADDLLRASLRLRPDRILLGELRGPEAFAFLRAVNSGHPGSITTVHADSCEGALNQIALLALTSGALTDTGDRRAQSAIAATARNPLRSRFARTGAHPYAVSLPRLRPAGPQQPAGPFAGSDRLDPKRGLWGRPHGRSPGGGPPGGDRATRLFRRCPPNPGRGAGRARLRPPRVRAPGRRVRARLAASRLWRRLGPAPAHRACAHQAGLRLGSRARGQRRAPPARPWPGRPSAGVDGAGARRR